MPMKTKEEQREYQRKWMAKRRKEWFDEHGPCVACGSWENLELDHIVPDQYGEHKVWSWSKERRDVELQKCQVLCHDCHRKKTAMQLTPPIPHGTPASYGRGCRCDECKKGRADYEYLRRYLKNKAAKARDIKPASTT